MARRISIIFVINDSNIIINNNSIIIIIIIIMNNSLIILIFIMIVTTTIIMVIKKIILLLLLLSEVSTASCLCSYLVPLLPAIDYRMLPSCQRESPGWHMPSSSLTSSCLGFRV